MTITPEQIELEAFKKLRERLGYTAKDVSEAFGLHPNYISRVERGERSYRHIYYLALLGIKYQASNDSW